MTVGRVIAPWDRALDGVAAALHERRGAVLLGPDGAGKTTLARTAAERVAPDFRRVVWITGTESAAAIPFAAVAHLIDVPAVGRTADVLRAAREAFGSELLLVVDDAHLLDRLSAALVYQLAVSGAAKLIVTASAHAPDHVAALWTDGLVSRIEVQLPGHDDNRLAQQVTVLVDDLPDEAVGLLRYLAVEDPLPLAAATALTSADAVQEAQRCGVLRVEGPVVRCVHPLFARAARATVGGPGLRRLRSTLVKQLAAEPRRSVVDRLRVAVLALDSDVSLPTGEMVDAAGEALRLGDLVLSERLARAAVASGAGSGGEFSAESSAGFDGLLTLAYALAWQGRGREADAVLGQIDPAGLTEAELMAWALPQAANQFWMLSEPERATAFLRATRNRVSTPAAQTTLDALATTFAMNAGAPQRALGLAMEVLASPMADDTAIGWAASTAALSCARIGRFDQVDAMAERAVGAGHPGLLRFTSGFGQTTMLLLTGELDRAQELARRITDFTQLLQPGRAVGEVLMADVLLVRGELDEAISLLRKATAALAPTGYSWGPLAWMLLAQALGRRGMPVEAGKALSRAESRHGLKSMLFAPELGLARAWTCFARKDSLGALAAAREAVRTAERGGQSAVALRALHDCVQLGDVRAVDALARVDLDCVFGQLTRDHARALTAGDSAALREVAARYRSVGMLAAAEDAAGQASA
ncbi:energy-coupling factor transporter ATP-binding protein EcfA2/tetratricopeptide (TPR) repeat protein [Mycobacterium frederiksbergense]|uniref:Energy-coupling factor transporter ATP-binding protein EcfA2/tetratricopeptide (TPR) repeat protein n=1 Tax=Mycolicibacterium frederiksbergense TaxID=117567 RepID=A0ABT6L3R1_9MYCO|nr:AAA family ATPase [Mycolicibacterium frederiksbergense]MDH6197576.1 energy-coupling factor transporter ATP-binding protein EcfA2/tetratricopeptide (TPR) repeat protein [Mycolicibacterium frederiksbergense]